MIRDPMPDEIDRLTEALESRDSEQISHLVNVVYPNVLWGKFYKTLSMEERAFLRNSVELK